MMSSGLAEHGEHAVAVARTVSLSIPRMRAKTVGTSDVARTLSALYELKDVEQPGADWTQRIVTVVVTGAPLYDRVRAPRRRTVVLGGLRCLRGIGKKLSTCKRGGVDARLQLALHEVRLADVDDKGDHDEHHDHAQGRQDQYLP